MAVTNFSPLLGLALPTTGDLSGTWGTVVNVSITDLIDSAIAGTTTLSTDANVTLTTTNGAANQARNAVLLCTGARTTLKTITAPAQSKAYIVINATTGGYGVKVVGSGPTTGVTIANGEKALIAWNGSDFVVVSKSVIDLAADVKGVLPTANGGTNLSSFTSGGAVYATSTSALTTGTLPVASGGTGITSFGTGIATFLGTPSSANLAAAVTDETGSGSLVFATSPTLVTPILGTPQSATLTNATGLPISTGVSGLGTNVATALAVNIGSAGAPVVNGGVLGTPSSGTATNLTGLPLTTGVTGILPIANGGTGTATPNLTQGSGVTITGTWPNQTIAATGSGGTITSVTASSPLASSGGTAPNISITSSTGSGAVVLATSPTLVTPVLGTPSSGTLTSCTGLPVSTGVSGLGTGVATALAVNVGSAGALVLNGGVLGTPSSGTLTNATGLPVSTGVSGLGTSVATALAVNVGSAGAVVVNGGALGTPSSGTLTNCTFPTLNQNTTGSAGSVATTNFSIVESGGKLLFKYGATTIASMDSSGNLITLANVTAYGTP